MGGGKFKFTPIGRKTCDALEDKRNQEFFMKWSMKGHLRVKYFNFNEPFHIYDMKDFVESFFSHPAVFTTLESVNYSTNSWNVLGMPGDKVTFEHIPCTVTSMEFFQKLENGSKRLVIDKRLIPCMEQSVDGFDGFYISNTLQAMVLDKHEETLNLYSKSEKDQFIFRLFRHFVLGGKWCQYEDTIEPYLDVTKSLYKSLVSVERYEKEKNLFVRSVVLKCTVYGVNGEPVVPTQPDHLQNFLYLIIDPFKRQVAALYSQYCDIFIN